MSSNSQIRNPHSALGCSAFRNPHSAIGNKGFTLIEIIIMIVMAGILLPAIIIPFVTGVRGSGKPELVTRAMYLAHQRMEELMKYEYGKAPELNPTDFVAFPTGDANYPGENEIHYVDNSFTVVGDGIQLVNDRGYKRIIVRVRDPETTAYEIYSVVTNFP
jgi:type II secretory pathway pseudopilin PulG